jgi:hypothetical protein
MKKHEMKGWKAPAVAVVMAALAAPAPAEMVSTDQAAGQSERDRVRDWVQREDAQKQLKAMGIAPETARERVDAMTDEEVRVVAGQIDSLAAGGAFSTQEWLLIIIAILLLIVIL